MTLSEALQQIAVENGYENWRAINRSKEAEGILWSMAAELYARAKWDEACEAMRANCMQRFHDNTETQLRIGSVPTPDFTK